MSTRDELVKMMKIYITSDVESPKCDKIVKMIEMYITFHLKIQSKIE